MTLSRSHSLPQGYFHPSVPRAAFSHSASEGKRFPTFLERAKKIVREDPEVDDLLARVESGIREGDEAESRRLEAGKKREQAERERLARLRREEAERKKKTAEQRQVTNMSLNTLKVAKKSRIAKLIAGAKKEGVFSWATNLVPVSAAKALEKDFKKYYGLPGVKFKFASRKSGTLIKRLEQEIRADKLSVDVVVLAAVSWLHSMRKRGNLMKYISPEDKHYAPAAKARMNAPGYWVADGQINTMAVNRDLAGNVKLTSWYDLTTPKFAGKVLVGDASRSETYTLWYRGLRQVLPKSYFEKLNAQNSGIISRGSAQRRSLMAGEYWFGTTIMARHNWIARKAGVKMDPIYPKEGVVAFPIASVIMAKAKHPNLAKLFVDYWRSVRGHHIVLSYNPLNSGRPLPPHKDPDVNKFILADDGIAPPIDRINIIPIDWGKIGPEDVKKWRAEFNTVFSSAPRKN